MNRNSNSSKQQPSTSNSTKQKKSSKDREKRKSQSEQQQQQQQNAAAPAEKINSSSPSKESPHTRQYAGISGESVATYAEQTSTERYTDEVCDRLAEDINYKLRQIIHTAMVKARLSGRNSVLASDISETFSSLSLDKVYGAPANPEFIPFGDEGLYYLNDNKINLIDLSEQEVSYLQPGDVTVERKWVPDEEISETLVKYYRGICEALVGPGGDMRKCALNDVESNCKIGIIIDWFYNFAYFLLSHHSSSEHLTLCAYGLIESLEGNPITDLSVSEKQLSILARLLLQKVFSLPPDSSLLRYTCCMLALLCKRWELRESVFAILKEKVHNLKASHPINFLVLVSSVGCEAITEFFQPNMEFFMDKAREENQTELSFELLVILNIIFKERLEDDVTIEKYHDLFGDTVHLFSVPKQEMIEQVEMEEKPLEFDQFLLSVIEQKNSVAMAVNLMKTRRKIPVPSIPSAATTFECEDVDDPPIKFKFCNFVGANLRERVTAEYEERKRNFGDKQSSVIVGSTTLLASVFKDTRCELKKAKCCDHTLNCYNL